jgi:hypothetical protein
MVEHIRSGRLTEGSARPAMAGQSVGDWRALDSRASLRETDGVTQAMGLGWRPSLDAVAGAGSRHRLGWASGTLERAPEPIDGEAAPRSSREGPRSLREVPRSSREGSWSSREAPWSSREAPRSSRDGGRSSRDGQPRTVEDRLVVRDASGRRLEFRLDDPTLLVRVGDEVTVIWAVGKGGVRGPVLCVRNHTTGDTHHDDEALLALLAREPAGVMWSAFLICTAFTPLVLMVPWSLVKRARARRAIARFKERLEFVHG